MLPGVEIGEGCSFGAMSFVNKSTEPWGVYVGIPCVKKSERSKEMLCFLKEIEKEKGFLI